MQEKLRRQQNTQTHQAMMGEWLLQRRIMFKLMKNETPPKSHTKGKLEQKLYHTF
jgi:hypothetical protein